jgi:hypothetical protein
MTNRGGAVWRWNPCSAQLFVICHFEAPQLPPCAQRILGVNLGFAGEPLAEIRGSAVKPFEPDAGNAAEGSGRWSVLRC